MVARSLRLKNFTAFDDLDVRFSKGINVITGLNGTGKTHILKVLYSFFGYLKDGKNTFDTNFQLEGMYANFIRDKKMDESEVILTLDDDTQLVFNAYSNDGSGLIVKWSDEEKKPDIAEAIYLPAKEMLTHARGLLAMENQYRNIPFDATLLDIVRSAELWQLKEMPPMAAVISPALERSIDGTVGLKDGDFYIKRNNGKQIKFCVEAEGIKKLGLLWQLIMNGSIRRNSLLLWDEPEANLNPTVYAMLTEILLELSRNDIQIVLTTHNYLLAKYFDINKVSDDQIMYTSIYAGEDGLSISQAENFSELEHNDIMSAYTKLVNDVYGDFVGL